MSSAVSIASVPSSVSGLESVGDVSPTLDKGQALVSHLTGEQSPNVLPIGIVPEYNGKPLFAAGDGDFRLWVGETCFETHKYLLKRFKVLEEMLLEQPSCAERRLTNARPDAEDFTRMFKVLYASILDGPIEFDTTTLVSALRVATAYHHPRLRTYAIEKLEQTKLDAIERIRIAREFGLQSWEEPAYLELCDRDEPITIDEASVLGMNAFVRVAGIREREQRRRGREVDTRANDQETERPGTPVDETSSDSEGNRDGSHASLLEGATADRPETQIQSDDRHEDASEKAELQEDEAIGMKPSFVNAPLGHDYAWDEWAGNSGKRLRVSDCTCRFLLSGGSASGNQQQCTITPCTAVALKNIQIQQLAHAKSIAALKASMDSHVLPSEAKHTPAPNTRANANISTGKEVQHMVQTLQGQ